MQSGEPLGGGSNGGFGGGPGPFGTTDWSRGVEWMHAGGRADDVVVSSRVRLARNLAGFPFVTRASREDRLAVMDVCRAQILKCDLSSHGAASRARGANDAGSRVFWIEIDKATKTERELLVERHLISKPHATGKHAAGGGPDEPRAVAVRLPDERLSIMVNEEDHLRIQVIRPGLALAEAAEEINAVDDALEAGLDYAFHPRFGYLTCCPTNVGTGIRLSVMLHLPGLKLIGEIDKVKRAADDMGLAVRGFYGEGSESAGDLYQLSNQTTLGKAESVLLHELADSLIPKMIDYERHARRVLAEKQEASTRDRVMRALGVLRHAHLLSADEAMDLLSKVRLGVTLGMIEGVSLETIAPLTLLVQQAHLARVAGRELSQQDRRIERAKLLRERLSPATN